MISIIVPIYNSSPYLDKCIKSILHQSYKDFELILVNDGSTDNSLNICQEFAKADSRIRVINKKNEGVDKARFTGLSLAKGEFVTFVDSDDWLVKDTLKVMYENMIKYNVDYVEVAMQKTLDRMKLIKRKTISPVLGILEKPELFEKYYISFFGYNILSINIWGKLYRRSVIDQANLHPSGLKMGEDLYFNLKLFPYLNRIYISDYIGYNYRYGGMTTKYNPTLYSNLKFLYVEKKNLIKKYSYCKANDLIRYEIINVFRSDIQQKIMFNHGSKEEIISQINEELDDPIWNDLYEITTKDYLEKQIPKAIIKKDANYLYDCCKKTANKQYLLGYFKKTISKILNYI